MKAWLLLVPAVATGCASAPTYKLSVEEDCKLRTAEIYSAALREQTFDECVTRVRAARERRKD